MIFLQMSIILLIFLTICSAISTPPPPSKSDQKKNHLKFEYGYEIAGPSGSQVREEQRDGAYTLGRYYVLGGDSNQKVEYLADNWGFHPYVEYSNVGPHSKSSTQIAHGEEAVKALHNSRLNNKNIFEQPTTLKLHRVPLDTPKMQQKKTSKPLKVLPSVHRPKELNQMALQPQQSQYYPSKQPEVLKQHHQQPQQSQYYPPKQPEVVKHHQQPQQSQYYPPKQPEVVKHHQQPQPSQYYPPKQPEVLKQHHQQPQYILEPPPEPQPNQIPVYFIQSGYSNPHQEQNYLYPPPLSTLQTTILVPVKNTHTQPEFINTYPQPAQMYFNGIQPSALPLIYEPAPPQAIVPLALPPPPQLINHHSVVLENIQDNIKNQLLEEQDLERQRIEHLYGHKINVRLRVPPNERLIESTRELVTAQDVININESLEDEQMVDLVVPAATPSAYYATPPKLSENPIVVQDPSDTNMIAAEQYQTVQIDGISSTEPTILVTPRPQLGTNHLAPINAAIQLQLETVKTHAPPKKQNVLVEIQKSVPYYLGKFEFVQDANKATNLSRDDGSTKYKYDISAETAENFELGKTILNSFDNFGATAVSSTKEPFQDNTNNLDQKQEGGQIRYHVVVPAQNLVRDRVIKPTIMVEPSPSALVPLMDPTIIAEPQYGRTQTTACDHQSGVTYLSKVPNTTKGQITNDVFPTAKPLGGTILESYQVQTSPTVPSYKTIGSATKDSLGLVPPMPHQVLIPFYRPHRGVYQAPLQHYGGPKKYRHARQSFADNLRIEYGFMPPLIPSVEIDEHGKPIEKRDI